MAGTRRLLSKLVALVLLVPCITAALAPAPMPAPPATELQSSALWLRLVGAVQTEDLEREVASAMDGANVTQLLTRLAALSAQFPDAQELRSSFEDQWTQVQEAIRLQSVLGQLQEVAGLSSEALTNTRGLLHEHIRNVFCQTMNDVAGRTHGVVNQTMTFLSARRDQMLEGVGGVLNQTAVGMLCRAVEQEFAEQGGKVLSGINMSLSLAGDQHLAQDVFQQALHLFGQAQEVLSSEGGRQFAENITREFNNQIGKPLAGKQKELDEQAREVLNNTRAFSQAVGRHFEAHANASRAKAREFLAAAQDELRNRTRDFRDKAHDAVGRVIGVWSQWLPGWF